MYAAAKVYHDGSHYVAIPFIPGHKRKKPGRKGPPSDLFQMIEEREVEERKKLEKQTVKQVFNDISDLKGQDKVDAAVEKLKEYCMPEAKARDMVEKVKENDYRAKVVRKQRFMRKAFLNHFNYFVTFTYDDKKHTAESFKKALIVKLCKLKKKYGWKYAGVWEQSPNDRVHFHGFIYVPEGKMVGDIVVRRDFSLKTHQMQETNVNTYFEERFGRNDFREIINHKQAYEMGLSYILKYITKSNEKLVYSRGLPMYLVSDINEDDELCRMGRDDRKIVLPDDFECWDEGEFLGNMSKETKKLLRTVSS